MTRILFSLLVVVSISFTWFACDTKFSSDRRKNIESGIVEQYCHAVYRYNVDKYLDCKSKEAPDILIELSDKVKQDFRTISNDDKIKVLK